jgi:hydrogenase expression/formation protein HypC
MCQPLPFQIVELLPEEKGLVRVGDYTEEALLEVIEDPRIGDFLILHGRIAVTKIDPEEAMEMLAELGLEAPVAARAQASAA